MIRKVFVTIVSMIVVLSIGGYFRFSGIAWDENEHLHPDERFLTMVTTSLKPVNDLLEYFDTENSTLNPHNVGNNPNYVYGTAPVILTKYAGKYFKKEDYSKIHIVGRYISGIADLVIILLVFFTGWLLVDRKTGIIASLLSASSVLQIQLAHYYTVDTLCNLFTFLSLFIAILITKYNCGQRKIYAHGDYEKDPGLPDDSDFSEKNVPEVMKSPRRSDVNSVQTPVLTSAAPRFFSLLFLYCILFGATSGVAVAVKISAAPIVLFLPLSLLISYLIHKRGKPVVTLPIIYLSGYLIIGGITSFLAFRVFQPYAFAGPGFLDFKVDENWLKTILNQKHLSGIDADWPPAMQWARRSIFFAGRNMVLWGMGLPLGIVSILGMLWVGWRIIKGQWRTFLLPWIWVAIYFSWQSSVTNPTMRYLLPVYPVLAIFSAWTLFRILDLQQRDRSVFGRTLPDKFIGPVTYMVFFLIIGGTLLWAMAFKSIYIRPITRVQASDWIYDKIPGPVNVMISSSDYEYQHILPFRYKDTITESRGFRSHFKPRHTGFLYKVILPKVLLLNNGYQHQDLSLELKIWRGLSPRDPFVLEENIELSKFKKGGSTEVVFTFDEPLPVIEGEPLSLSIEIEDCDITLQLMGSSITNETSWDDSLPLRRRGYDPYSSIYVGNLNFEMYWDDNEEKRHRFKSILNEADYIIISSSRQWASLTRMPERFPLVTLFYRELLGIPKDCKVEPSFNKAEPGMFQGRLGFDLIKVFQSDPCFGIFHINDQPSEEAFTVYDHPKVLVFKKSHDFDEAKVEKLLSQVNLENTIHLIPGRASLYPANFILDEKRMKSARESVNSGLEITNQSILNRSSLFASFVWYCTLTALGFALFPLIRWAIPMAKDRGFAFSRVGGLLLWTLLTLFISASGFETSTTTLLLSLLLIATASLFLWMKNYREIVFELNAIKVHLIISECLFAMIFTLSILIRSLNPQVWFKGCFADNASGYAHFLSVMTSPGFPLLDPFFGQGYVFKNYFSYMYGGILAKFMGILPEISFNIVIATIYALAGCGTYSLIWNYLIGKKQTSENPIDHVNPAFACRAGLFSAGIVLLSGNLGFVKSIVEGIWQQLGKTGLFNLLADSIKEILANIAGNRVIYEQSELFFSISRTFTTPQVSDFPLTSFLMGNMGVSFLTLPVLLLCLTWLVSLNSILITEKQSFIANWKKLYLTHMISGGILLGILQMSNEVDFLLVIIISVFLLLGIGIKISSRDRENSTNSTLFIMIVPGIFFLIMSLTVIPHKFWSPFTIGDPGLWKGPHTTSVEFLYHVGPIILPFLIWLIFESVNQITRGGFFWISRRNKLFEIMRYLLIAVMIVLFTIYLAKTPVAYLIAPLIAWSWLLITSKDYKANKRFPLLLFIAVSGVTCFAEITQFSKIGQRWEALRYVYFQLFVIYAIVTSLTAQSLVNHVSRLTKFRNIVAFLLILCFLASFTYSLLAIPNRILDRLTENSPLTLNGLQYMMEDSTIEKNNSVSGYEKYSLLQWLRENCEGSGVILEADPNHITALSDLTALYTGLPSLLGSGDLVRKNRQSKLLEQLITKRSHIIRKFYTTDEILEAKNILHSFDVQYFIVGEKEYRLFGAYGGFQKFSDRETINLWKPTYKNDSTIIYKVLD